MLVPGSGHRLWFGCLRLRFTWSVRPSQVGVDPLRMLISIIAALIGLTGAEEALAQSAYVPSGFELRGGVLAHDVPGLWSGFRLESGVDINAELLGPGVAFLGGTLRPAIGGSVNTAGYTSKAYLDARWEIDLRYGVFFGLGLGAAIHDGNLDPTEPDRKALGSRVLFHIPFELGYRFDERQSISVYFEHMSNGNLADHNEALDSIGIRYGYRF
jgi:lipid A 3-O-deacylase